MDVMPFLRAKRPVRLDCAVFNGLGVGPVPSEMGNVGFKSLSCSACCSWANSGALRLEMGFLPGIAGGGADADNRGLLRLLFIIAFAAVAKSRCGCLISSVWGEKEGRQTDI